MAMKAKMLPHQKRSRSQPPTIGPVAMPIPVVAPHSPMAMARSPRSVKTLTSKESVEGNIRAAPKPMKAREAMSSAIVPENAPARLPVGEDGQPDEQDPLAAQAVAQASCRQDEGGEHQAVGVHDPLELGGGGPQLPHQRRKGNVDDRHVHADDECRQTESEQNQGPSVHAFFFKVDHYIKSSTNSGDSQVSGYAGGVRSYGQYCSLAKALDIVGDRWTLLIAASCCFGHVGTAISKRACQGSRPTSWRGGCANSKRTASSRWTSGAGMR